MLTTLSEVEGESRKLAENQIILDPGSHPAPRDLAGMTNSDKICRGGYNFKLEREFEFFRLNVSL